MSDHDELVPFDDQGPAERDEHTPLAWRAFEVHARCYVLVNVFLVAIWAVTGMGYFWPVWPIMSWGLGLGLQGATTFTRRA